MLFLNFEILIYRQCCKFYIWEFDMKAHVYSVSQINKYIKKLLLNDVFLNDVFIEAEISNFKAHDSGHFYFTLKDEYASINVVMYRSYAEKIKFLPENGMKVTVYGYISLYEKTGQYQLYAYIMEPTGKGALYAAFEQLKERLEKEGLFDVSKKKSIPLFPERIAVLTSPTGAAVRDVIQILRRRNPNVKLIVVPVLVQGDFAPKSICDGLRIINRYKNVDLIILGRGGGSIEDLWCFNDESVARAVFKSKIPVISAVGHETDFTITDFVADLRAPTPSAAAEISAPCLDDIKDNILSLYDELFYSFVNKKHKYENRLKSVMASSFFKYPFDRIYDIKEQIKRLYRDMDKAIFYKIEKSETNFKNLVSRLEDFSPMNVVKRGFSVVYKNGEPISSVDAVSESDIIDIKLSDGYIKSKVIEKGDLNAQKENF